MRIRLLTDDSTIRIAYNNNNDVRTQYGTFKLFWLSQAGSSDGQLAPLEIKQHEGHPAR